MIRPICRSGFAFAGRLRRQICSEEDQRGIRAATHPITARIFVSNTKKFRSEANQPVLSRPKKEFPHESAKAATLAEATCTAHISTWIGVRSRTSKLLTRHRRTAGPRQGPNSTATSSTRQQVCCKKITAINHHFFIFHFFSSPAAEHTKFLYIPSRRDPKHLHFSLLLKSQIAVPFTYWPLLCHFIISLFARLVNGHLQLNQQLGKFDEQGKPVISPAPQLGILLDTFQQHIYYSTSQTLVACLIPPAPLVQSQAGSSCGD